MAKWLVVKQTEKQTIWEDSWWGFTTSSTSTLSCSWSQSIFYTFSWRGNGALQWTTVQQHNQLKMREPSSQDLLRVPSINVELKFWAFWCKSESRFVLLHATSQTRCSVKGEMLLLFSESSQTSARPRTTLCRGSSLHQQDRAPLLSLYSQGSVHQQPMWDSQCSGPETGTERCLTQMAAPCGLWWVPVYTRAKWREQIGLHSHMVPLAPVRLAVGRV